MSVKSSITLDIMDKKFKVNCDSDEKAKIIDASELLNSRIAEIKKHGKSIGSDRVAIMAALNIANDFVVQEDKLNLHDVEKDQRISTLLNRIENTLQELK